jgi:predicted nucleic acid-binding protein
MASAGRNDTPDVERVLALCRTASGDSCAASRVSEPEKTVCVGSAMTLGELQAGVEITRELDPSKAAEIEAWIDLVAQTWNVLPVDARVFRSWAKLMHRRSGHLIEDALIAATAIVHHLTVVTAA